MDTVVTEIRNSSQRSTENPPKRVNIAVGWQSQRPKGQCYLAFDVHLPKRLDDAPVLSRNLTLQPKMGAAQPFEPITVLGYLQYPRTGRASVAGATKSLDKSETSQPIRLGFRPVLGY